MENFSEKDTYGKNQNLSKSGVTKPNIELEDFYEFLDSKIVEKIKQTSMETKNRISQDVSQYENDIMAVKNIIKSFK